MRNEPKIVIGSSYRPTDKGSEPLDALGKRLRDLKKNTNSTLLLGVTLTHAILTGTPTTLNLVETINKLTSTSFRPWLTIISLSCRQSQVDTTIHLIFSVSTNLVWVKYTITVLGISDNDVIVAEAELRPMYTKKKSWELYIYSKAYWQSKKANITLHGRLPA